MYIHIAPITENTLPRAVEIWNQIVEDGIAFPQEVPLTIETGRIFFAEQSAACTAETNGNVVGLYILHPNNVGRCGHICNASYAVARDARGMGVGKALVSHCLENAKALGFRILQFNAVVATNRTALSLYKKLGFTRLGTIPAGFRMPDGHYEDIIPHYIAL